MATSMNPDCVDLLRAFSGADVRFLVIGAYALAVHGRPRGTGDLDVWVERVRRPFGGVNVDFIGRAAFIRNKKATGRTKDLADSEELNEM